MFTLYFFYYLLALTINPTQLTLINNNSFFFVWCLFQIYSHMYDIYHWFSDLKMKKKKFKWNEVINISLIQWCVAVETMHNHLFRKIGSLVFNTWLHIHLTNILIQTYKRLYGTAINQWNLSILVKSPGSLVLSCNWF